ncbi:unnamed protein product [Bemisia tabaci]|uniref:Uncharacterized protein n=1 Tax=Bemisia tabaci TaxID=7038 RepID=A0A9P0APV4_BEMTA|nr:unnamed protein product [Bemisia tabaci]
MIKAVDSSFQEMFVFEVTHQSSTNDIISFLIAVREEVITFLSHVLRTSGCQFELCLVLECEYEHLVTKERKVIQHTADILPLLTESDIENKFDTSVSKILRAETEFEDCYKDCLFSTKDFTHEQRSIVSKKLLMYTIKTKKKSLSTFDDKRVILRDGIYSLPLAHYAIENNRSLLKRDHEELLQKIPPCMKMEDSDCKKRTTRKVSLFNFSSPSITTVLEKNNARRTKRKNTSMEEVNEVKKKRVLQSEEEGTIRDENVNSTTSRKRKTTADSEHDSKKKKSTFPDHEEAVNTLKLVKEEGQWRIVNDAVVK